MLHWIHDIVFDKACERRNHAPWKAVRAAIGRQVWPKLVDAIEAAGGEYNKLRPQGASEIVVSRGQNNDVTLTTKEQGLLKLDVALDPLGTEIASDLCERTAEGKTWNVRTNMTVEVVGSLSRHEFQIKEPRRSLADVEQLAQALLTDFFQRI